MNRIFTALVGVTTFLSSITHCHAQKFSAERGTISFFSDAAVEDISAKNTVVGSIFNAGTGEVVYVAKIKDFIFPKSLMREHFNEKYMETDKFPKSTFQGKITGYTSGTEGIQKVRAVGKLTMHGVTRDVDIPGTLEFTGGKINMNAKFLVKLADYQIKIPKLIWQNLAEEIEVTLDFTYKAI